MYSITYPIGEELEKLNLVHIDHPFGHPDHFIRTVKSKKVSNGHIITQVYESKTAGCTNEPAEAIFY